MPLTPQVVDQLSESAAKLMDLWMNTKLVFLKAFGEGEIAREHEAAYMQLKSEVSRIFRTMAAELPKGMAFDGEKMIDMLKNAMTMEHLHTLPPGERQALLANWHRIYIKLSRTCGALGVMKSGYFPHLHRDRMKSAVVARNTRPAAKG
jgi:hypothetical protein